MEKKKGFLELKEEVVDCGLCQGCGACSGFCPTSVLAHEGEEGEPALRGECHPCGICYAVCGGKDIPLPRLEEETFGRRRDLEHPFEYWIGVYRQCLAGHVRDPELRQRGASGAMASGLINFALEKGQIEAALLTGMDPERPWRAGAFAATTPAEVSRSQQSKYQTAPTLTLLSDLARRYRRIGLVGLPCQIWPLRKAAAMAGARRIAERVVLRIGIFCAAQYYFKGTEHLIQEWGGVEDIKQVTSLEYRGGDWPGSFRFSTRDGRFLSFPQHEYKYHHLIPYYQRDRCTMCLDYSADLADISVGDIWTLSEPGEPGWNAVLTRTAPGEELLKQAEAEGAVVLKPLDPELILSGTVGLKSKLVSNTYRFANRIRFHWPVPDYGYPPTGYLRPWLGKKATWSK
ncbi:MAG: Coenzyme F420 hydrogenase/dehydrogenase, beta subunit C-terminal domain [Deltaproteobacteria bacterium]|nr:Coenzyme F420 hydrogenase/dehydrogenase, beta subunit C-terminal domain [Deltaproteobacteria bacterium]